MADNELVAAILAAGMLPPLPPLPPPAIAAQGLVAEQDQVHLVTAILHAVGLYRSILEAIATRDIPAESPTFDRHPRGADRCEPVSARGG